MDVVQSIVNADNRSEVEKFTSCLDNWKQWSWTLSPGPLPRRLSYLPESDSGVSFHQLLTPDNKQKIITIEVCIYKSISEKAMATHSNTLAWKIPWTEEPGRLQSMGSVRVRHDFTFTINNHTISMITMVTLPFPSTDVHCRIELQWSQQYSRVVRAWAVVSTRVKFQPSILTPCMTWPNDFTSLCVSFLNCK